MAAAPGKAALARLPAQADFFLQRDMGVPSPLRSPLNPCLPLHCCSHGRAETREGKQNLLSHIPFPELTGRRSHPEAGEGSFQRQQSFYSS